MLTFRLWHVLSSRAETVIWASLPRQSVIYAIRHRMTLLDRPNRSVLDIRCPALTHGRTVYMTLITELQTRDVRFPTSRELAGSDAMNPDPDYSAAYVVIRPDGLGRARLCVHNRPRQRGAGVRDMRAEWAYANWCSTSPWRTTW